MEQSLTELFQEFTHDNNLRLLKFEKKVMDRIENEASTRVSLRANAIASTFSAKYGIPVESLLPDIIDIKDHFCRGIKKDKTRCLKVPKDNGYCGFHQKQVPLPPPPRHERVPCPWEKT